MENFITQEEEDLILSNFYFLIFTSNPVTQKAEVIIDGGTLKLNMKNEKLIDLVSYFCGIEMGHKVYLALQDYKDSFMVDRMKNKFYELGPMSIEETLSIKEVHELAVEAHNRKGKTSQDDSIQAYHENVLNKVKTVEKQKKFSNKGVVISYS